MRTIMRFLLQLLYLTLVCDILSAQSQTQFTFNLQNSWNMISLPLHVSDNRVKTIFPTSTGIAYSYNNATGYKVVETVEPGKGYWIKMNGAANPVISGSDYLEDTIDVSFGWNMIGTINMAIPKSSVKSIPEGIILGRIWNQRCGECTFDTMIAPGQACWVKVKQDGKLILKAP